MRRQGFHEKRRVEEEFAEYDRRERELKGE
jgi:hypothetical protein